MHFKELPCTFCYPVGFELDAEAKAAILDVRDGGFDPNKLTYQFVLEVSKKHAFFYQVLIKLQFEEISMMIFVHVEALVQQIFRLLYVLWLSRIYFTTTKYNDEELV
uniref:Uncharacterized protein n=1 Tax=Panagrolaimus sp. JU765 TaxID=591449 RepID=A0AC34RH91_9BILA